MANSPNVRADPVFQSSLQLALCRQLFAHWPWLVALSALGPAVQSLALLSLQRPERLAAWLGFCAASAAFGAAIAWRQRRLPARQLPRLLPWLTVAAMLHGLEAGLMVPLFMDFGRPFTIGMLPATMCALAGIAVVALHAHRPAMLAMLGGVLAPSWVDALFGSHSAIPLVSVPLVFAVLAAWGWRGHAALRELLCLRLENRRLTRQACADRAVAERADRAKARFLAVAGHDLRQPMQGLQLQLEALQLRTEHDRVLAPQVGRIVRTADALGQLLEGLWEVAQVDVAPRVTHSNRLSVAEMLEDLAAEYRPRAAKHQLQLRLRVADGLQVDADAVVLRRILHNLLENALRYTEQGGILLAARRRGGRVLFEVWDTGIGIEPDDQARVFEEFFRATQRQRPAVAGLGVGLAISRRLAQQLGGSLRLRSQRGRGSVFVLSLAAVKPAEQGVASSRDAAAAGSGAPLVVLLDPDARSRNTLAVQLGRWGYRVVGASNIEQALQCVADLPQAPDLVITPLHLGAGDGAGTAAVERLRDEFNQPLPALMLSAVIDETLRRAAADADCGLLQVPVDSDELHARLNELLAARAVARSVTATLLVQG